MIEAFEDRLAAAMLGGDVEELEQLTDDDMIFTGPDGSVMSKADDLAAHGNKVLQLDVLERFDGSSRAIDGRIVVTTKARLAGKFAGKAFAGTFAYTRVWRTSGLSWLVIVGHAAQIGPLQ
jgi:hypothetical protein